MGMLHQCRTSEEVWVMLKQDHDPLETEVRAGGQYPRLRLAIEYGQKEVYSSWCQVHCDLFKCSALKIICNLFTDVKQR